MSQAQANFSFWATLLTDEEYLDYATQLLLGDIPSVAIYVVGIVVALRFRRHARRFPWLALAGCVISLMCTLCMPFAYAVYIDIFWSGQMLGSSTIGYQVFHYGSNLIAATGLALILMAAFVDRSPKTQKTDDT